MAEAQQHIDFVEVTAKDILPERQRGWEAFTRAAAWTVGAVAVLLILLKIFFG